MVWMERLHATDENEDIALLKKNKTYKNQTHLYMYIYIYVK